MQYRCKDQYNFSYLDEKAPIAKKHQFFVFVFIFFPFSLFGNKLVVKRSNKPKFNTKF